MSSDDQYAPDPRYSGLYQRGGGSAVEPSGDDEAPSPSVTGYSPVSAQHSPEPSRRMVPDDGSPQGQDLSPIRQIDAEPAQEAPTVRAGNPFDAWIWVAAVVLLALGLFFVLAPTLYAETISEQANSGFFFGHWSQQSGTAAAPLLLVGSATAVTQLFVLSHRRTRRPR